MCGITGFIEKNQDLSLESLTGIIHSMRETIKHRGPDDQGIWIDKRSNLALGHSRLSIIDLSTEGHQPMISPSERYVIVYNGEVYNFLTLRMELEGKGYKFRGHSDTEVILASIEEFGILDAVKKFEGMFAFALWDSHEKLLYLVRDRLGIKPLYYGWINKTFLFGSELKALRAHPQCNSAIKKDALSLFMRLNYIPAPYTIYENIYKLVPGCILKVNSEAGQPQNFTPFPISDGVLNPATPVSFWSSKAVFEHGARNPFKGTEDEAADELEILLRDAVVKRMISDVPIGAFLSGGIDSSLVVALMQSESTLPVKTFTIGFYDRNYNEAEYSKAVAKYLGTDHTELYVSSNEAQNVIPQLPSMFDEPFSDPSQIPTFLVSQMTRKHVTVSLSGDGGDEFFAGYNQYFYALSRLEKINRLPSDIRRSLAWIIKKIQSPGLELIYYLRNQFFSGGVPPSKFKQRLFNLGAFLEPNFPNLLYYTLQSNWKDPSKLVFESQELPTFFTDLDYQVEGNNFLRLMMYIDTVTYLPDDILVKVDRASMAVGLEARVPLIDHRVAEFASTLPNHFLVQAGSGKSLLRKILFKYVPQNMLDRPKKGFGIPIGYWLKESPLRDWASDLLNKTRLKNEGYLDPILVTKIWGEHLSGKRDWTRILWSILVFESWLRER